MLSDVCLELVEELRNKLHQKRKYRCGRLRGGVKGVSYPEKSFFRNKPFLKKVIPETKTSGKPLLWSSIMHLIGSKQQFVRSCLHIRNGGEICEHLYKLPKRNSPTFPAFLTSHLIEMCGSITAGEWYRYCQITCYAVQCCTHLDHVLNWDSYECSVSKRLSRATSVLPICEVFSWCGLL